MKKYKKAAIASAISIAAAVPSLYTMTANSLNIAEKKHSVADVIFLYHYIKDICDPDDTDADINSDGRSDINDCKAMLATVLSDTPENIFSLMISEVCTDNSDVIEDRSGSSSDWTELYNSSTDPINLSGVGVSDDPSEPFKYILPDITLDAGERLIIFADKDGKAADGELMAPFSLDSYGDTLLLSDAVFGTIDKAEIPPLQENKSYGRYTPEEDFSVLEPTPNDANDSVRRFLNGPMFSEESGFYTDSFSLTLKSRSDCTIYYTTDGSLPTAESKKYTRPIKISDRTDEPNGISMNKTATYPRSSLNYVPSENITKGTVIRAVEVDEYGQISEPVTKSYFVGIDQAKQYKNMPVFSLAVDPDDLFDYDTGIYTTGKYYDSFSYNGRNNALINNDQTWLMAANFTQKCTDTDKTWEKEVHVDFFEGDSSNAFSQDMGVRIFGASSRANMQKSLKLIARSSYGMGKLKYELIPDAYDKNGDVLDKFDSFILRCGANDASWTKLRDPVLQELVRDRDFESQCGRPAIAFLNGEYWGLYQITEDYSDNYISNKYGYKKKNVVIIKNGELEDGTEEDLADYKSLIKFVRSSDMSTDENYEKLCSMVDVQSLADYHASQIYINNQDIYGDAWLNNCRMWKLRSPEDDAQGDGRWRYMLYDTEYSTYLYGRGGDYDALKNSRFETSDTVIFSKTLRQNKKFRELFLNTIMDLANENYTPEKTKAVIDKYYKLYSPLMEEHVKRFGPTWRVRNLDNGFYENQIEKFKGFFTDRREKLIKVLPSYGLGSSTSNVTIKLNDIKGGSVKINTIIPKIGKDGWNGIYFNGCDITFTAVPEEGYEFKGWSGAVKGSQRNVTLALSEDCEVKASFKKK